jgi:signal transduction histidine kinase
MTTIPTAAPRGPEKKAMSLSRVRHLALMSAAPLALLGALAFLVVKTQAIDFQRDAQALALLREMKDIDIRWDQDALHLANDFSPRQAPSADRGALIARNMQELERGFTSGALAAEWPKLRAALSEKQAAHAALRAAHARTVEEWRSLDEALRTLAQFSAARAAARSGNRAAAILVAVVEQLRSELGRPDIETFAQREGRIDHGIATLRQEALAIDPSLAATAAAVEAAGHRFIAARAAEAAAWRKSSFLTLDARIELTSRTLAKSIESALDDKNRWRVYLLFYAGALLLATGALGMRVVKAQGELRRANEMLEKRVAERTRDLSQALRRLQESEAQLVQTEKMASLGQMVAGVAHEINTPLAYVKNSVAAVRHSMPDLREAFALAERLVTILAAPEPDAAELRQAFDSLSSRLARLRAERALEDLDTLTRDGLEGIEQIVELVANLRNFARLDRSRVASFNVNEGIRAALLIARSTLKRIEIEQRLGDAPSITCSPSQVNQVLLNLLTNAAQAMDKPNARIVIATRPEGSDAIAIAIEDNGKGIEPEILPRIFDPFFTTKEPGKGTGLGLAIAYKIVAQHGGRIDVRSTPGTGTVMTVTLPIQPPPELASQEPSQMAAV